MRALLVVNPKATTTTDVGTGVLADALRSEVKLDVEVTGGRGHAVSLARQAVDDGLDVVVALGGDGTVNEVVNGLLATGTRGPRPALAVVPGGSTNVFARSLGLPDDPLEATGVLLAGLRHGRRRPISLGRADERWFTFCAGMGFDAEVVRRVERRRDQGHRASHALFVREALLHYSRPRRSRVRLEVPGRPSEQLGIALVCNARPWTYLGSRPVVPCRDASFETGLDVFGLRSSRVGPVLRALRQSLSRRPPKGRDVLVRHDVEELTMHSVVPLAVQVDGDDIGDRTSVRFTAVRDALDIVI